ncbi:MAG: collagen-like triple helix repeat-containing protein [Candidatus Poseidoniaceae archaeon]
MAENKPTRKQKILKFLGISSVIISLVLSSIALYYTSDIGNLESGVDGKTTLSKTGSLYGTHGCEDGGFSIQSGIDSDGSGILEGDEVTDIKNVCHGTQGPPGPMGNRGYWGHNGTDGLNGTDGINGTNGEIGVSSFIGSHTGSYGPCQEAVVIEMGNNSSSGEVESSIKICFQELDSGRMTDIHPNSGNSFSTGCNGGLAVSDLFVFAAALDGNCLLYKIQDGSLQQISASVDFAPGSILGFIAHENRIWFDANDGGGTQLWSTDGLTLWQETNLSVQIQAGDRLIEADNELVLQYGNGLMTFGDNDSLISGTYSNLASANDVLIYSTGSSINLNGTILNGELNSDVAFHDGYYWFIATSDSDGPQLHRSDSLTLEKMTTSLQSTSGQIVSPTVIGNSIVFDSDGLVSFNTTSLILSEMNTSIVNLNSQYIVKDGMLFFQCGIPSLGYELCTSNGDDAWLHSDYASGMDSSTPQHFTIIDNRLVGIVDHPTEGGQLVEVRDEGMVLLWDYHSGNFDAGTQGEIWFDNQMIYFIGDDPTVGLEMYGWAYGELTDDWIVIH